MKSGRHQRDACRVAKKSHEKKTTPGLLVSGRMSGALGNMLLLV